MVTVCWLTTIRHNHGGDESAANCRYWIWCIIQGEVLPLGDVCQLKVTASGIDTPLQTTPQRQHCEDHYCAHLKVPKVVVNPGVELGMRYAVILEGPFSFPKGYRRVSSVLFLCCNNPQELQKELTIQLRHWANVTGKGSGLCFMKANHELGRGESCYSFTPMEGGDFDKDSGHLRLSHFCFLCALNALKYNEYWKYVNMKTLIGVPPPILCYYSYGHTLVAYSKWMQPWKEWETWQWKRYISYHLQKSASC